MLSPAYRFEDDVPALAAVATVGAAIFDELFAAEGDGAGAAGTAPHENLGLIQKMHEARLAVNRGGGEPHVIRA